MHLSPMWGPFSQIPRIPNKNNQKVNLKCISEQVLSINKQPSVKLKKLMGQIQWIPGYSGSRLAQRFLSSFSNHFGLLTINVNIL